MRAVTQFFHGSREVCFNNVFELLGHSLLNWINGGGEMWASFFTLRPGNRLEGFNLLNTSTGTIFLAKKKLLTIAAVYVRTLPRSKKNERSFHKADPTQAVLLHTKEIQNVFIEFGEFSIFSGNKFFVHNPLLIKKKKQSTCSFSQIVQPYDTIHTLLYIFYYVSHIRGFKS